MVKKSKAATASPSPSRSAKGTAPSKKRAAKHDGGKKKSLKAVARGASADHAEEPAPSKKAAGGKKRAPGQLALFLPLSKARKLAGDLYQSASLAFWAEAIEKSSPAEREILVKLQDSVCDVADLLKEARSANPRRLHLYWVAFFDRDRLPASPPRFVTAASEAEALELFKAEFRDEIGRRKPRAQLVPHLAEQAEIHP